MKYLTSAAAYRQGVLSLESLIEDTRFSTAQKSHPVIKKKYCHRTRYGEKPSLSFKVDFLYNSFWDKDITLRSQFNFAKT